MSVANVTFTAARNGQRFSVANASVTSSNNVMAVVALQGNDTANPGDDTDSIDVTAMASNGSIDFYVKHNDPRQKLLGLVKINYQWQ